MKKYLDYLILNDVGDHASLLYKHLNSKGYSVATAKFSVKSLVFRLFSLKQKNIYYHITGDTNILKLINLLRRVKRYIIVFGTVRPYELYVLVKLIKKNDIKLIVCNLGSGAYFFGNLLTDSCSKIKKGVILECPIKPTNPLNIIRKFINDLGFKKNDYLLNKISFYVYFDPQLKGRTQLLRRILRKYGWHPNAIEKIINKMRYIPPTYNETFFHPAKEYRHIKPNPALIPHRIDGRKGHDIIVEAARIANRECNIKFLQVSWGDPLWVHILLKNKPKCIKLVPKIPRSLLPKIYNMSSVVIGNFSAGSHGSVEREAAVMARPVVLYDRTLGSPFLPKSKDPSEVAEVICKIYCNEKWARSYTFQLRDYVVNNFSPKHYLSAWDKLLFKET